MPIYRRKLSKGDKYWYKFDFNGKTYHSKAIYPSKNEAKKAEARAIGAMKQPASSRMTFFELCELRMDLVKTKSPYYYKDHRNVLKPLVALWKDLDITEIDR